MRVFMNIRFLVLSVYHVNNLKVNIKENTITLINQLCFTTLNVFFIFCYQS